MKKECCTAIIIGIAVCAARQGSGITNYVGVFGVPSAHYFTNIQSAVDATPVGGLVLVSNGMYSAGKRVAPGYTLSNRVVILSNITVRSVNGPTHTFIRGSQAPGGGCGHGAVRCVYMAAGVLSGFTLTNGYTLYDEHPYYDMSGGGIQLKTGSMVTNCMIMGNSAYEDGGGVHGYLGGTLVNCTISGNSVYYNGGGAWGDFTCTFYNCTLSANGAALGGGVYLDQSGVLSNCTISGNTAYHNGGGAYCYQGGTLLHCTLSGNSADLAGGGAECAYGGVLSECTLYGNSVNDGSGGGVYCAYSDILLDGGTLLHCTITGNSAWSGGGVYCNYGGVLSRCTLSGNSAENFGGGVCCSFGGTLTNCLISGMNTATDGGGVRCFTGGEMYNCTISGNSASARGGGIYCTNAGTFVNVIVFDNSAATAGANWYGGGTNIAFHYCCTTPTNNLPGRIHCIPNDPMFVAPGSDYRLQEDSPCIEAGTNMAWMIAAKDLDGNDRIVPPGSIVDMGCYEFVPEPASILMLCTAFLIVRKLR